MKQPLISIMLPFYNAATTLAQTLESISRQNFNAFEVIGIDDGSTDISATLFKQHASSDPRFFLHQQTHQGVVVASNVAIKLARADWIARMDADDLMLPNRLSLQWEFTRRSDKLDVIGTQVELFPPEQIGKGMQEYIQWQNHCLTPEEISNNIYVELPIAHPTTLFRKQVLINHRGYREGDFPEDYELLLRLNYHGHKMGKVAQKLVKWRQGENRLTHTDPRYSSEAFSRIRAHYLSKDIRLHKERPVVIWGAGRSTRKRVDYLVQEGIQPSAWIDIDSKKIGHRYVNTPVHPPQWLQQQHRPFVLSYVNNYGARKKISDFLNSHDYILGKDYLFVG